MSSVISLTSRTTFWNPAKRSADFLDRYQFTTVAQPIFSPTHQRLVGYEGLIRVAQDERPVPPPTLFAMAHQEQQTDTLDRHLLHLHLESFARHRQPVWLFLNITPETCIHPDDCLAKLADDCQRLQLPPGQVVLEVVETSTDNKQALLDFVQAAKARGFQIAIDDFGVGDSNFERLWQLEPQIVKLDRSLLVNASNNRRARQLLESLVRMIRESGSLVLLEGIENEEQARIALATEADLLQGFLFGHPAKTDDNSPGTLERRFRQLLDQTRLSSFIDDQAQDGFLRLLRFEILEACHEVMRRTRFDQACQGLLGIAGVKRCFLLDEHGVQQGNLARASLDLKASGFNPLYGSKGACWAHREYVRNAMEQPQQISASRPYVALPDAARTITLSTGIMVNGQRMIFCVDVHPDQVFDGQLCFPRKL